MGERLNYVPKVIVRGAIPVAAALTMLVASDRVSTHNATPLLSSPSSPTGEYAPEPSNGLTISLFKLVVDKCFN